VKSEDSNSFNASVLLICAFIYSICLSFSQIEFLFCVPVFFMMACKYKKLGKILKKLLFLNLFIGMIFLVLVLQDNINEAINIYLRVNLIILFNLLLFYCSNGFDIVRALDGLRFPIKTVSSIYFTLKMIQTLNEEFSRIKYTLKARGFHSHTSLFVYETYGNLFGHIFVVAIRKSNALQESFILRGFSGKIYLIQNSKYSRYDLVLSILVCIVAIKGMI